MGSQGLDFSFYDNFYHLIPDWRSMQVEMRQEDYISGKCLEILRRGHEIVEKEGAIEFWRIRNKGLSDVLTTGSEILIVSSRVIEILERYGFTGWRKFKVVIKDKKKGVISEGYWGISVVSNILRRRRDLYREVVEERLNGTKKIRKFGWYFEPEDWDGSDFNLLGGVSLIVTKRVKDVFEKEKVKNISIKSVHDISV